ncbi:acetyltransferase (GNAT) family protein [Herbihabitans rhizosphaerae]|uniref:Acetyltransferase (GNAT) family protein n=1 Tax=Herbihabitans rhizosphaerae TaxID=1872711 RepID=A0A4Q7L6A6_9PSEU|nr:GNAT family N-acetyltransferase [Herbihabitans rhizosphaerae]RZS45218.1 acetyltransferase (GNAT) family protein [Herbihabitans rhizosphaerae]
MTEYTVRAIGERDRPAVRRLLVHSWGTSIVVAHGTTFHPGNLPGLLAERRGQLAGALTYAVEPDFVEVVTIDAEQRRAGIGSALIDAVIGVARQLGRKRVVLTTTNDNLDALRFYQRRGFRLSTLRPGAVTHARRIKPEIPDIGDYGIPVNDELDLERAV